MCKGQFLIKETALGGDIKQIIFYLYLSVVFVVFFSATFSALASAFGFSSTLGSAFTAFFSTFSSVAFTVLLVVFLAVVLFWGVVVVAILAIVGFICSICG